MTDFYTLALLFLVLLVIYTFVSSLEGKEQMKKRKEEYDNIDIDSDHILFNPLTGKKQELSKNSSSTKGTQSEGNHDDWEKVIDNMLLKFLVNIHQIKSKYDVVTSMSEIIKSYYLKGIEIDKMIEHFGKNIRINTLDKLRTEELTIDDMYSSIEGFYLICEELRKIIETQQKLLSEGKISETRDALLYNYWSSNSLHLGYVEALILFRNDPKYGNNKSKVDIMKLGEYMNKHIFYYSPS